MVVVSEYPIMNLVFFYQLCIEKLEYPDRIIAAYRGDYSLDARIAKRLVDVLGSPLWILMQVFGIHSRRRKFLHSESELILQRLDAILEDVWI